MHGGTALRREQVTRVAASDAKNPAMTWNTAGRALRSSVWISTKCLPIDMTSLLSTRRTRYRGRTSSSEDAEAVPWRSCEQSRQARCERGEDGDNR